MVTVRRDGEPLLLKSTNLLWLCIFVMTGRVQNQWLSGYPDTQKKFGRQPHFRFVVVRGHPCLYGYSSSHSIGCLLRKMSDILKLLHVCPSDTFFIFLISKADDIGHEVVNSMQLFVSLGWWLAYWQFKMALQNCEWASTFTIYPEWKTCHLVCIEKGKISQGKGPIACWPYRGSDWLEIGCILGLAYEWWCPSPTT